MGCDKPRWPGVPGKRGRGGHRQGQFRQLGPWRGGPGLPCSLSLPCIMRANEMLSGSALRAWGSVMIKHSLVSSYIRSMSGGGHIQVDRHDRQTSKTTSRLLLMRRWIIRSSRSSYLSTKSRQRPCSDASTQVGAGKPDACAVSAKMSIPGSWLHCFGDLMPAIDGAACPRAVGLVNRFGRLCRAQRSGVGKRDGHGTA